MLRRIPLALGLAAALLVTPALAGCSVENIVDRATGGNVDLGGDSVPDDFPSEVPLYDGEVLSGIGIGSGEGKIWNVGIRVPDSSALDEIQQQLTDAGFETQAQGSRTKDGGTVVSTGSTYGVAVVVVPDDGGFVANYSVTATPE